MPNRVDHTARRLVAGTAVLVGLDVVGGLVAVAADVNTWPEAWGNKALLAAPAPMIVAQAVLTAIATLRRRAAAVGASALLAVACLVSVTSAFFDGALGNDELSGALTAFQLFLLGVTGGVGLLAVARTVAAYRLQPSAS